MGLLLASMRSNMIKNSKENFIDQIKGITELQNEMQNEYLKNPSIELEEKLLIIEKTKNKILKIYGEITNEYNIIFNSSILNSCPEIQLHKDSKNVNNEIEQPSTAAEFKVIKEIYDNNSNKNTQKKDTNIIISPVNNHIIKYLKENPNEIYNLGSRDFEMVMMEIYHKLGYEVDITQQTRDGGKDIIIRTPTSLGDFIYYVECKRFASDRPIGVGIVRNMVGTIVTDKVNGGIIATTSYFSSESIRFINENNLKCQIQMHDFDKIRLLLNEIKL